MTPYEMAVAIHTKLETLAEMTTWGDNGAGEKWDEIYALSGELMNALKPRDITMRIIALTRDMTKNSGSPFWRCATMDGKMVNVFKHEDELKDTFHLFEEAGFGEHLMKIPYGESQNWVAYPIKIRVVPNGNFWNVIEVAPIVPGQEPDIQEQDYYP